MSIAELVLAFFFCTIFNTNLSAQNRFIEDTTNNLNTTYSLNLFELPLQYPTVYSTNQNNYTLQTLLARSLYENTSSKGNALLQSLLLPTVLIPYQNFQSYQSSLVHSGLSGQLSKFAFSFPDVKIKNITNDQLGELLATS
ncbi:hypothetical protein LC612_43115, partial [Nostoc sp. CHAB 5834]|nr:hypothetical protein [Nostoc sp. CHAB 5834]